MDAIITIVSIIILIYIKKRDKPPEANLPIWEITGNGTKEEDAFMKVYNNIMVK